MINGNIPLHDKELEEIVLGSILLERQAFKRCTILKAVDFYYPAHQLIFSAFESIYKRKEPIDLMMLNTEMTKSGKLADIGGISYLAKLTNKIASSANLEHHSAIICQYSISRQAAQILSSSLGIFFDKKNDHLEEIQNINKKLRDLMAFDGTMAVNIPQAIESGLESLKSIGERILSGFDLLDKSTRFFGGTSNIIAARPGGGKSDLMMNMARNIAKQGKNVLVISLEMQTIELIKRLMCAEMKIDNGSFRTISETIAVIEKHNGGILGLPIWILDKSKVRPMDIDVEISRLDSLGYKPDAVFIDYLQLMRSNERINIREQEISSISRDLKALSKEHNIPFFPLAQLGRSSEGVEPNKSHLRESGAIEQDADTIIFPIADFDNNTMNIKVEKNRHGNVGIIEGLNYQANFSLISEYKPSQDFMDNSDLMIN